LKPPKKSEYPQTVEREGVAYILHRNYCFLIGGKKYQRNLICKLHDNAYGVNGGGDPARRKTADTELLRFMRDNRDPMAYPAYWAVRIFGWAFFNYTSGALWRGQLKNKITAPFARFF
jgi:hypothetical protein